MVAVVTKHVITSACKFFGELFDDLSETVVHKSCLSEEQLTIERIACTLGIDINHSRLIRIGRYHTIAVFIIAKSSQKYPISTPVW